MGAGKTLISFVVLVSLVALSTRYGQSYYSRQDQLKNKFQSPGIYSTLMQETTKYRYRGAENCASVCHNNDTMGFQYDTWKKGPHAKAYFTLTSKKAKSYARTSRIFEDPRESSLCLRCHITAEGADSTFLTPTYRKEDGVTCEACHKKKYHPSVPVPLHKCL